MPAAISFDAVSKRYADAVVLDGLRFSVDDGALFALIGVNGAGKTTSIKALLDFVGIDAGRIELFGTPHRKASARRRVAFLPERFAPPYFLTGEQYLRASARLLEHACDAREYVRLCDALELPAAALRRAVRTYSKGMSQKLGLMAILASDKDLLLLDEPLSGLDPKARILVKRELERTHAAGRTVFYSSHQLADVQALGGDMVILHQGHARYAGSVAGCCANYGVTELESAFLAAIAPDA